MWDKSNFMSLRSDGSFDGGELDAAIVQGNYKGLNPVLGSAVQQNPSKLKSGLGQNIASRKDINKQIRQTKLQNFKTNSKQMFGNVNNFLGSEKGAGILGAAGAATDLMNSFVKSDDSNNPTGYQTQQKIGDAMLKTPIPIVQAAGVAYKALSGIAEATGGNINTITKDQAEDIGISKGTRLLNNIVGTLHPGAGWFTKEVEEGQKSHLIDEMSNAYADTVSDIDQAGVLGGGKYLFGKKKVANAVAEANRRNELLTEMNMTNTMRKQSDYGQDLAQQNLNRYAGTNYMDMRMGRQGMRIPELDSIRELLKNRIIESTDIQKFADGGSILPVGSRHKNLNHLSEINPELGDLTRKGIPVVALDESGDMVQVAEIECSEACFSKDITDQLESLWKDGSEEAMIAAGKLVANEILYNMKDEDNIIWGGEKQQMNS